MGKKSKTQRAALIGDIKGSRTLKNWPGVFKKLKQTLDEVNRRFAGDILIPFQSTVGDEFQGVLKTPEKAFDVYTFIKASLPVGIYCGIGVGEVENSYKGDLGLRGTAFYRARNALEICKEQQGTLRFRSSESENQTDEIINEISRLIETIETAWTKRQRQIVDYYRIHPDQTHQQISDHFKVDRIVVTKILKATHFSRIAATETLLRKLILDEGDRKK